MVSSESWWINRASGVRSKDGLKLERREQKIEGFKLSKNMPKTGVTKASLKHVKLPV